MIFKVFITGDAEQDLFDIFNYIYENDSPDKADYVFQKIKHVISGLKEQPNRGHFPPELERINIYEYRELHFKPYRIIYAIEENKVFIHCIIDGRRNLQDILANRLIR